MGKWLRQATLLMPGLTLDAQTQKISTAGVFT